MCNISKLVEYVWRFLIRKSIDILHWENNIYYVTMLQEVKSWLCKCFSMKDLREAAYIFGIKIIRDRSKRLIALSQSAYLEKIVKRFWMENSNKGDTPVIEKPDYRKSQGVKTPSEVQSMQRVPYTLAIGLIMAKLEAELKVSCYVDASFQTDKDDTNSQTRYVFVILGGAVDWKSAKQSTTAISSTEVEYIAAAEASIEAIWMRKFIDRLGGVMPLNKRPMKCYVTINLQ
ncbi:retrotransposon protein, putative, ty1-copia subclass [Tanacetum coccineum]